MEPRIPNEEKAVPSISVVRKIECSQVKEWN